MSDIASPARKSYVLAEIDSHDAERYRDYVALAAPAVAAFGGRFLVRGGDPEAVEGDGCPQRFVIIEFDGPDRAREYYRSALYQKAAGVRQEAATTRYYLLKGA